MAMLFSRENPVGGIVRLLLLCLVVGLILSFFDITPQHIVSDTLRTLREIYDLVFGAVHWAVHDNGVVPSGQRQNCDDTGETSPMSPASAIAARFIAAVSLLVATLCAP